MHSSEYTDLARLADERGAVVAGFVELTPTEGGRKRAAVLLHLPDLPEPHQAYVVTTALMESYGWKWASRESMRITREEAMLEYAVAVLHTVHPVISHEV